jgi:hypothetical protein
MLVTLLLWVTKNMIFICCPVVSSTLNPNQLLVFNLVFVNILFKNYYRNIIFREWCGCTLAPNV